MPADPSSFRALLRHPQFQFGLRDMSAVSLGLAAWGLVTGVAMVNSGMSIPMSLLMSFTMYAGSVQLAAIPLMAANTPIWVIWATALCLNLRFVIFSAQWRPFFQHFPRLKRMWIGYISADLSYVLFMKRFREPRDGEGQTEYFLGLTIASWLAWQIPSILGILMADMIPTNWGLGFAGVIALLGLTYSLLSDKATATAALVAGAAAVAAFALPFRLHIVVAIAAAVCVGLMIDGGDGAGRRVVAWLSRSKRAGGPPSHSARDGAAA